MIYSGSSAVYRLATGGARTEVPQRSPLACPPTQKATIVEGEIVIETGVVEEGEGVVVVEVKAAGYEGCFRELSLRCYSRL